MMSVGPFSLSIPPKWPQNDGTLTPPMVALIAGYRRTGKDTLGKGLRFGTHERDWLVYAKRQDGFYHGDVFDRFKGAARTAFADEIRTIARDGLGLPVDFDFDAYKDSVVERGKTIRQHLIDIGTTGRAIDKDFWVKKAFLPFFANGNGASVICTDWRFTNEYHTLVDVGAVVFTMRVFRPDVPIPPETIESEHDLDSMTTDYLLLRTPESFPLALEHWPSYASHERIGTLGLTGFTPFFQINK